MPTTIADEKRYNVFMRCEEPEMLKKLGTEDPVEAMRILREWKNTGNKPSL